VRGKEGAPLITLELRKKRGNTNKIPRLRTPSLPPSPRQWECAVRAARVSATPRRRGDPGAGLGAGRRRWSRRCGSCSGWTAAIPLPPRQRRRSSSPLHRCGVPSPLSLFASETVRRCEEILCRRSDPASGFCGGLREPRHARFCEIWVYGFVHSLELLRLFGSMVYFTARSWRLLWFERAGERRFGLFSNGWSGIVIYHISFV
jgi:hypothetical protein